MNANELNRFFEILNLSERLKFELRHSWLSSGRQESVAEHTWRLSFMLVLLEPHLSKSISLERVLKMAIIHDLVEAEVGDVPVFDLDDNRAETKRAMESQAIENIRNTLSNEVGNTIYELWHEFELAESYEAKLVNALDKLECKLQHTEACLSTWNEKEKACGFDWQNELYDFDPVILQIRDALLEKSRQKVDTETV